MTPLIDVVFILLVFFMLTTRLLPVDYLELSNDTSQRSTTAGDPHPELRVEADGRILWRDTRYSLQELMPALTAAGVSEANLETAPEASLASFTHTLSALDNAGITPHWKRSGTPES
ncbi:ExbD/TolR family protein [Marinobacter excellens]|jgi:biopolymer transport protein ExbD|uniref:Biopolymer transport protein ExbD/TolR n=1 Tax=Marinobacter excellens LAMA 842 TaxID=1306954 RepID=A0A137SG27_9GAMM|nr:biopolymer transporter ExbD [Marinobacter excellens]KXO10731.1 hypothetical protein J122_1347 [Marinobacter excellens LAMA 842]KXO11395.1 hypothetical protein J122_840 [Marinobacter excellens LAMA 842]